MIYRRASVILGPVVELSIAGLLSGRGKAEVKVAVNQHATNRLFAQLRRYTDPDPYDPRYPRFNTSLPVFIVRGFLLLTWTVIVAYLKKAADNLVALLNSPDPITASSVWHSLLIPKRLYGSTIPQTVSAFAILASAGLVFGCLWAVHDTASELLWWRVRISYTAALRARNIHVPFDTLAVSEIFVGRQNDREWLLNRLRRSQVTVSALWGLTGIGKTAVAGKVAEELIRQRRFPGGVVAIACQDLTAASDMIWQVLIRLDPYRRASKPDDLDELSRLARHLIVPGQTLIILDGARSDAETEIATNVLHQAEASILLTLQENPPATMVPREGVRQIAPLSLTDAVRLFTKVMQYDVPLANTQAPQDLENTIRRIVSHLACHTYAIKLVATSVGSLHLNLRKVADGLESQSRLTLPDDRAQRAMMRAFRQSVATLPPEIQRLLTALAAFSTLEFGHDAALALAKELELGSPQEGIDTLILRSLVEKYVDNEMPADSDQTRLRVHPLVGSFIADRFNSDSSPNWLPHMRDTSYRAVARYYAEYCNRTSDIALIADEANVVEVLEFAHMNGQREFEIDICLGMATFWRNHWRMELALRYLPSGVTAAEAAYSASRSTYDQLRVGRLLLIFGQVLLSTGQLDKTEHYIGQALGIFQELGERTREGNALMELGWVARQRARPSKAEEYFQRSLAIFQELELHRDEATSLHCLGEMAKFRRRFKEAEIYEKQSLRIRTEIGDAQGRAECLLFMGRIARQQGHYWRAERRVTEALQAFELLRDQRAIGACLLQLGRIAVRRSQRTFITRQMWLREGESLLKKAYEIACEIQERRGQGLALYHLALIADIRHNDGEAESKYRRALGIFEQVQSVEEHADTLQALGFFLINRRLNKCDGCTMIAQSIKLYVAMESPDAQVVRTRARKRGCSIQ